jgi:hypothetical protein
MANVVTVFKLRGLTTGAVTIQTIDFAKMSDGTFKVTYPSGAMQIIDPSETPGLGKLISYLLATPVL